MAEDDRRHGNSPHFGSRLQARLSLNCELVLSHSMEDEDVQRLLSQQLRAVQKALALNVEIACKLGGNQSNPMPQGPFWSSTKPNDILCGCTDGQQDEEDITFGIGVDDHLGAALRKPLLRSSPSSRMDAPIPSFRSNQSSSPYRSGQETTSELKPKKSLRHLFPHVDDIKDIFLAALRKNTYCAEDLYSEEGLWQRIARHTFFQDLTVVIICFSTLYVAVETDYNKALVITQSALPFQVCAYGIAVYFSAEIFVRFMAFKKYSSAFQDGWFIFDLCLVLQMLWDTVVLPILHATMHLDSVGILSCQALRALRLPRVLRVARTARLVKAAPELMILTQGILAAIRSVIAVMVLLTLVIYIYACVLTQMLAGYKVVNGFDTVPESINSLLLMVLCGAESELFETLLAGRWFIAYGLFITFNLVAVSTIMNMLIGILCGVVSDVTCSARDEIFDHETEQTILALAKMIDRDQNGKISQAEFHEILHDADMTHKFHHLGVDVVGAIDFAQFVFSTCGELSFTEFQHLMSQFRHSKHVSAKDLMDMRRFVAMEVSNLETKFTENERPNGEESMFTRVVS